ncbi:MAG TPA: hypothetical protein PKB02_19335 [Anaerohalosphaeraceae bacterium]|nr:hypothetical protein [Anaerohalosphaeraceae bacterium]
MEGVLNTFEFSEKNWDGKVNFIKVFDSTYSKTLWHIKAIREIQTKNFYVKIGEVPDGFEQVLPSDDTPFLPVQGKKYILLIDADFSPHVWTGEISWIAK